MARVTVEDCLKFVKNRFDLVIKASKRAHALEMGAVDPMVEVENDKPTVVALREIAAGFDVSKLKRDENEVIKMDELEEGLLEAAEAAEAAEAGEAPEAVDAEAKQEESTPEEAPKEAQSDAEEKPLPNGPSDEN